MNMELLHEFLLGLLAVGFGLAIAMATGWMIALVILLVMWWWRARKHRRRMIALPADATPRRQDRFFQREIER